MRARHPTDPAGAATAADVREAFDKARATDPVSAFGGIIGFNRAVTEAAARAITDTFFEAIVAPDYEPAALEVFAAKKNLRILRLSSTQASQDQWDLRVISDNGMLLQDRDRGSLDDAKLRIVSKRQPSEEEMRALRFAWIIAKHVKSNAIVYARDGQLVGVGVRRGPVGDEPLADVRDRGQRGRARPGLTAWTKRLEWA